MKIDDHPLVSDSSGANFPDQLNGEKKQLEVILRRYDSGGLSKAAMSIHDSQYITISHVWGTARWQDVLGEEVLVSDEKARFIAEELPSLVGGEWFWMDILCVNQRDKESPSFCDPAHSHDISSST